MPVSNLYRKKLHLIQQPQHPKIALTESLFYCNGQSLYIGGKPIASRVIKAFFLSRGHKLRKEELVAATSTKVKNQFPNCSERFLWSKDQAANRLMSRLRALFSQSFQGVVPAGFHWFYYDQTNDVWLLYKLPSEGADGKLYA